MSSPVLHVQGLCKSFGALRVIDDISIQVEAGERRLLLGPNGAGKTTLFNLITGDLAPTAGSIRLFGQEVSALPVAQRVAFGIARTYQIITLFPHDSLLHNVKLALLGRSPKRWSLFKRFDKLPHFTDQAMAVLERVGLVRLAHAPLAQTSYGEKRRLEIALALAQDPKLLLLDEPLAGLSAAERMEVQQLLAGLPRSIAILMIEHDMDVALQFAEKISLLHYGKLIVEGSRSEVAAHPRTKEVYLGH
jgi:branched-chain amino acid transport system ATP-binding protein